MSEADFYATAISSARDAVIASDDQGRVVEVNPAAENEFGVRRSDAIGRMLTDFVVDLPRIRIARASEDDTLNAVERARLGDGRVAFTGQRMNGTKFPIDVTITALATDPPRFTAWMSVVGSHERRTERGGGADDAERLAETGRWQCSRDGTSLSWSPNVARLFGFEGQAPGPARQRLIERIFPRDREQLERLREAALGGGEVVPVDIRIVRLDGVLRYLRLAACVEKDRDGRVTGITGTVRDVTHQRLAERRIAARHAVSHSLTQWRTFEQGAAGLLEALATTLDCEFATLWLPEDGALAPAVIWTTPALRDSEFEQVTRRLRLPRGVGVAGRAWELQEPVDFTDVPLSVRHPRREAAARAGLETAVALPIVSAHEVLAVIDLHVRQKLALAEQSMLALRGIGYEIGTFLARRRGQLTASRLTPREVEVLQLAADGLAAREIAARLMIGRSTVKTHFDHVYAKLEVADRAAAVAKALREGLID
jgi:PAS domain S-box-containing protein